MNMKKEIEELLDSLIVAHRIETPPKDKNKAGIGTTKKVVLAAASVILLGMTIILISKTATISSSSTVGNRELPIYCVEKQKPQIALTFDAAWGNEDTAEILRILKEQNVHVTFFMTGGWVESYPEDVKAILAAGHDLGNHSENHKNMSQLTDSQKKEEIMKVHNRVKELTGYEMFLFRAPYGDYDNSVIKTVYNCNYYPIQWDVDSLDWKDYGVNSIIQTVCENPHLGNGTIILCHNGAKYTSTALNDMITKLKEQGYEIVPVSELIYRDHYHMDHEGRQIPDQS